MLWNLLAAFGVRWAEFGQVLDTQPAIRRGPAGRPAERRMSARPAAPRTRPSPTEAPVDTERETDIPREP